MDSIAERIATESQLTIDAVARSVYSATREFYDRIQARMGDAALGYEIDD